MTRSKLIVIGVILLFATLMLSALAHSPASFIKQPTGKIKGLILDLNDARITTANITIESSPKIGLKKQLKSGEAGDFEIELPEGIYYLTVEANGFCRFEGWELKVSPQVTEMVNIHLEVLVTHTECRCTLRKR